MQKFLRMCGERFLDTTYIIVCTVSGTISWLSIILYRHPWWVYLRISALGKSDASDSHTACGRPLTYLHTYTKHNIYYSYNKFLHLYCSLYVLLSKMLFGVCQERESVWFWLNHGSGCQDCGQHVDKYPALRAWKLNLPYSVHFHHQRVWTGYYFWSSQMYVCTHYLSGTVHSLTCNV